MHRSKASHPTARLFGGVLALVLPTAGLGTTINVPTDSPTIQAAVDVAAPGDTILVEPGTYQPVRITGNKAGVTIEAADVDHPPIIQGVRHLDGDGIRVDQQDGITLRNLIIQGAYDGVRLNYATNALLIGLHLENNARDIRVNRGHDNTAIGYTMLRVHGDRGTINDGSVPR